MVPQQQSHLLLPDQSDSSGAVLEQFCGIEEGKAKEEQGRKEEEEAEEELLQKRGWKQRAGGG